MKKMNKKGFTLIELLAIIVILAIIAVITVPLILGIIDEAKEKANISSVVGYGKSVEFSYSKIGVSESNDLTKPTTGTGAATESEINSGSYVSITLPGESSATALKVDFSGDQVVCSGANVITDGKLTLIDCKVKGTGTDYLYDNGRACVKPTNGTTCPTTNQ